MNPAKIHFEQAGEAVVGRTARRPTIHTHRTRP